MVRGDLLVTGGSFLGLLCADGGEDDVSTGGERWEVEGLDLGEVEREPLRESVGGVEVGGGMDGIRGPCKKGTYLSLPGLCRVDDLPGLSR